MFNFPVELEPDDNNTLLVTFPDVPGAITFGDDAEALARAVSALETVLNSMMADRQDLPEPSTANGRPTVAPTLLGALKLSVYQAMRARGWRKIDLANAMELEPHQVDWLLDLRRASTAAQLDQAMWVCGRQFAVSAVERKTA